MLGHCARWHRTSSRTEGYLRLLLQKSKATTNEKRVCLLRWLSLLLYRRSAFARFCCLSKTKRLPLEFQGLLYDPTVGLHTPPRLLLLRRRLGLRLRLSLLTSKAGALMCSGLLPLLVGPDSTEHNVTHCFCDRYIHTYMHT